MFTDDSGAYKVAQTQSETHKTSWSSLETSFERAGPLLMHSGSFCLLDSLSFGRTCYGSAQLYSKKQRIKGEMLFS